ncbi:RNA 2',3'-cyclic phosphodiesterase [Pseudoponticoccus marisrubri]|uniref:RNA 2',3'-cyclic phosphodiesterase n=1 Tax=Pseudoponticoccus marisrubri TaxID=1685382 RepID=A0A0W7WJ19_9RHOB|nr:RNA 2',3'-cyclic phosphodiesterase [Pseudoponticoccus marisrubri]KUF10542.1 hypothetical protein AVJ23_11730 [Pseudoponticoccus marisrubri]
MRLFIALTLPEPALDAVAAVQDRLPAGRAVPVENLHLTLAFLGDQPEDALEPLDEALRSLRAPQVALALAGAEVFGGRHGQAVALGAEGGPDLADLHARVAARVRGAGVAMQRRRFRPHVTVARLSGRADAGALLQTLAPVKLGPYACGAVALTASTLHRDGAQHEVLASYPLG